MGLSVERVKLLLGAVRQHRLYALFVLAATMGLRRGELLGLHWSDRVPLPPMAWQALKAHRGRQAEERLAAKRWEDHGLVFPTEVGTPMEPRNLNRLWASLRTKVGMEDVKLHDLRHTMVTLLLDLGTAPHIVQAVGKLGDRLG